MCLLKSVQAGVVMVKSTLNSAHEEIGEADEVLVL